MTRVAARPHVAARPAHRRRRVRPRADRAAGRPRRRDPHRVPSDLAGPPPAGRRGATRRGRRRPAHGRRPCTRRGGASTTLASTAGSGATTWCGGRTTWSRPPPPALVTVHDLTTVHYPELADGFTLAYPDLIRRAVARRLGPHAVGVRAGRGDRALRRGPRPGGDPPRGPGRGGRRAGRRRRPGGADRYLLAVGTVEPRKDLPTLVAAFDDLAARHPDLRLVIAGGRRLGAPRP